MTDKTNETQPDVVTHNMWKIIVLMVHGHSPMEVLVGPIEGAKSKNKVLKYKFPGNATGLADAWDRGDDSETMKTIRKVKNSMELFKENLRIRLP